MRILQLSDVHLGTIDVLGREPSETLRAVIDDVVGRQAPVDAVVVTGDIVHEGQATYASLFDLLSVLDAPVYVLPGNHDLDEPFGRECQTEPFTPVNTSWSFGFADSNHLGRAVIDGVVTELPGRGLLARRGQLDPTELSDLATHIERADTPHVFLWAHHPPLLHLRFQGDSRSDYYHDVASLAGRARVRGFAFGHLHCSYEAQIGPMALYCCPSTWLSLDFEAERVLPPGYRTYDLHADGHIEATTHYVPIERYADAMAMPDWVLHHLVDM